MLVVWGYDLDNIIPTCRDFEDKLIKLVWEGRSMFTNSCASSSTGSDVDEKSGSGLGLMVDDKEVAAIVEQKVESSKRQAGDGGSKKRHPFNWGLGYFKSKRHDVERSGSAPRPVRLLAALYAGVALGLSICGYRS